MTYTLNIPVILYTRDKLIDDIVNSTSITCFNLDTSDNIDNHIDKDITIQGNFDPKNFHADNEVLREMAQQCLLPGLTKSSW